MPKAFLWFGDSLVICLKILIAVMYEPLVYNTENTI